MGRVYVLKVREPGFQGWAIETWRLFETDGTLCRNWAPGLELDDPDGPLDRGGFEERSDARAFALGVDRWRAEHGLIHESVAQIDAERAELDGNRPLPFLDELDLDQEGPSEPLQGEFDLAARVA